MICSSATSSGAKWVPSTVELRAPVAGGDAEWMQRRRVKRESQRQEEGLASIVARLETAVRSTSTGRFSG